jgi:hypothetical protein
MALLLLEVAAAVTHLTRWSVKNASATPLHFAL